MKLASPVQTNQGALETAPQTARSREAASQDAKRVGLFGIFGTGNFGNDGSLEAMVISLRRTVPAEPLLCICTGPEGVTRSLGIEAVPIYYQPKADETGRAVRRTVRQAASVRCAWSRRYSRGEMP